MSTIKPTTFQLALALALGRAKPNGLSIKDFIFDLRSHIHSEPRSSPQTKPGCHFIHYSHSFNALAYWQKRSLEAETKKDDFQNQISALERQLDTLKPQSTVQDTPVTGRKRKTPVSGVVVTGNATKRAKSGINTTASFEALDVDWAEEFESTLGGQGAKNTLLRNVYELRQLLKQNDPDMAKWATSFCQTCSAAGSLFPADREEVSTRKSPRSRTPKSSNPPRDAESLEPFFRAMGRISALLFHAFNKLVSIEVSKSAQPHSCGAVTYALVALFRSLLEALTSCARSQAISQSCPTLEGIPSNNAKNRINTQPPTSLTSSTAPPSTRDAKEDLFNPKDLAQLLHTFITPLSSSDAFTNAESIQAHANLANGFLHLLLTRAGTILHTLAFSHSRDTDIDKEIVSAPTTEQRVTSTQPQEELNKNLHLERHAATIEAKYLWPLISRALSLFHAKAAGENNSATNFPNDKLVRLAKDTFQRTLLKGVFGDLRGIEGDVLQMPPPPPDVHVDSELQPEVAAKGQDEENWLVREMWELCGWDILGREFEAAEGAV